jgi:hypothetical protein
MVLITDRGHLHGAASLSAEGRRARADRAGGGRHMRRAMLRLAGRAPRLGAAVNTYTQDVAIDGTRLQRVLGFSPSVSLSEGWQTTVASMRAAP